MSPEQEAVEQERRRRHEAYELERAKMRARYGHSTALSESAVDVLFEQAWEDRSHCGSFTIRLLVNEICRLRLVLRSRRIDPETGCEMREEPRDA